MEPWLRRAWQMLLDPAHEQRQLSDVTDGVGFGAVS